MVALYPFTLAILAPGLISLGEQLLSRIAIVIFTAYTRSKDER